MQADTPPAIHRHTISRKGNKKSAKHQARDPYQIANADNFNFFTGGCNEEVNIYNCR